MRPAPTRRFPIRTVTALSLFAATAACSDKSDDDDDDDDGGGSSTGIVATWGLDTVYIGDKTLDYPQVYSYSGEDGSYSYTYGIQMQIDSPTSGEWCYYYIESYNGETYTDTYCDYDMTITETGTAQYAIQIPDMELDMTCDISGAFLNCTATQYGYYEIGLDWVRLD